MRDNPTPHVEGGPDCWVLKIRVSPEVLREMAYAAHCTVEIGKPDEEGFVDPQFTKYNYHGSNPESR